MRKQTEATFDGATLALPELSAAAAEFVHQHPEAARVAVTAALEAVAAHFDSARDEARVPEALRTFVVETSGEDDELIGAEEAAQRLAVSRATVYNWIEAGRLVGWRLTRQGTLIPAEQILGPAELVPGIDKVLEILPEPRAAWRFLKEESPFFDTPQRPIDALKAGRVDDVVEAARTSGAAEPYPQEKSMSDTSQVSQRTVAAPPPTPASSKPLPNRVFSVVLKAYEDVEWSWTSSPDGVSYVSGYTIVRRVPGRG